MNKSVIITIIITALISSLITYTITKKSIESNKLRADQSLRRIDKVIFTPTPTEKPTLKYSITILNTPIINGNFILKADVKNISLNPFMTWVHFGGCKFVDNKGNEYKGTIDSPVGGYGIESQFSSALQPGENRTVKFNRLGVSLLGGGGIDPFTGKSQLRCQYDNNGNKICVPVDGLKIKNCTTYTSTSIKREDQFPLVVNFPQ